MKSILRFTGRSLPEEKANRRLAASYQHLMVDAAACVDILKVPVFSAASGLKNGQSNRSRNCKKNECRSNVFCQASCPNQVLPQNIHSADECQDSPASQFQTDIFSRSGGWYLNYAKARLVVKAMTYFKRPLPDVPPKGEAQISTSVSQLLSVMLMTHHLFAF